MGIGLRRGRRKDKNLEKDLQQLMTEHRLVVALWFHAWNTGFKITELPEYKRAYMSLKNRLVDELIKKEGERCK